MQALRDGGGGTGRARAAEIFADYDDGVSSGHFYVRREEGDTSIDSALNDRQLDSLGAQGEVRLLDRGTEEHPDDGIWLAGDAHAERGRGAGDRTAKGGIELVRRTEGVESAMGLHFQQDEEAGEASSLAQATSRLAWSPDGSPVRYGLELRAPLSEKGDVDASHEIRLQAAIDVTDRFALTATWESANPGAEDEDGSGLLSIGGDWAWGDSGEAHMGLTSAYGGGSSGQALFLGLDQSWELAPGWEVQGGLDIQRDLGATQIPLGLQSDNPWIATSFTALRAGARYTAETWSLGIDAEGRTAPEGDRGNVRLSGDGEFGQGWTFGADLVHGGSDENGTSRRDTEARLSFAHRLAALDPITLIELERDDSLENGVSTHRLEVSLLHSRYLGEAGELTLRGALRGVETLIDDVGAKDTLTLLGAEYRHDLSETWDIGFHNSLIVSARTGDSRMSYGVSVGMSPFENGYLEMGYNVEGFEDEEFSEHGYTDEGLFMSYRMKFDQNTIQEMFR